MGLLMNGLRSGFSVLAMVARPRPVGSRGRQEDPEQYAQLNGRMGQALGIVTNVPPRHADLIGPFISQIALLIGVLHRHPCQPQPCGAMRVPISS
jgi:hypothetical protein